MAFRIESVNVRPFRLEFTRPYGTSRGTIAHRDLVELELLTSDGRSGRGETASLSLRGGPAADAIVGELTGPASRCLIEAHPPDLARLGALQQAPAGIAAIVAECRAKGIGNQALCAIDLALFDLAGKLCGVPAWRLLGGGEPAPVQCNATLVAGAPKAVVADADEWATEGFSTFKVKAGTPDDVEAVKAVRDALGTDAAIRVDANAAWDATTALERLVAMGGPDAIELAEQPCADVLEMAQVRLESGVTIAADESVVDADTAGAVARLDACDLTTVKLAKVGGISAALEVADQLPTYVSSALDGPIGIAAGAHLVQALRARGTDAGIAHGLATQRLFAEWPGGGARLEGPLLHLPEGPGLGIA